MNPNYNTEVVTVRTSKNVDKIQYHVVVTTLSSCCPLPPAQCTAGLLQLFQVAKASIPASSWSHTPLVLKATAGLRLLPGEKAMQLLNKVRAHPATSWSSMLELDTGAQHWS